MPETRPFPSTVDYNGNTFTLLPMQPLRFLVEPGSKHEATVTVTAGPAFGGFALVLFQRRTDEAQPGLQIALDTDTGQSEDALRSSVSELAMPFSYDQSSNLKIIIKHAAPFSPTVLVDARVYILQGAAGATDQDDQLSA